VTRLYPPGSFDQLAVDRVLDEVFDERRRQHTKWGEQNHPDGTDLFWSRLAEALDPKRAKEHCDEGTTHGFLTFAHILVEEVAEALAETDPERLRAELLQVAAVAVSWVEAIDRRRRAELAKAPLIDTPEKLQYILDTGRFPEDE
jgi:hypothetical protein